jgi:hypothetical protein
VRTGPVCTSPSLRKVSPPGDDRPAVEDIVCTSDSSGNDGGKFQENAEKDVAIRYPLAALSAAHPNRFRRRCGLARDYGQEPTPRGVGAPGERALKNCGDGMTGIAPVRCAAGRFWLSGQGTIGRLRCCGRGTGVDGRWTAQLPHDAVGAGGHRLDARYYRSPGCSGRALSCLLLPSLRVYPEARL